MGNFFLPSRVRIHIDYLEAKLYAEANGKSIGDLTIQELFLFKKQAIRVTFPSPKGKEPR